HCRYLQAVVELAHVTLRQSEVSWRTTARRRFTRVRLTFRLTGRLVLSQCRQTGEQSSGGKCNGSHKPIPVFLNHCCLPLLLRSPGRPPASVRFDLPGAGTPLRFAAAVRV